VIVRASPLFGQDPVTLCWEDKVCTGGGDISIKSSAVMMEMAGGTWNHRDLRSTEFGQGADAMRAKLQHYLNSMHVYCRLVRYLSEARARRWARSWETAWLYKNLLYAKQKESEHLYSESIGFDELNVPICPWGVRDTEMPN
jgi:hypothetical protein